MAIRLEYESLDLIFETKEKQNTLHDCASGAQLPNHFPYISKLSLSLDFRLSRPALFCPPPRTSCFPADAAVYDCRIRCAPHRILQSVTVIWGLS